MPQGTLKLNLEYCDPGLHRLVYQFDYAGDPGAVVIDMSNAHIWDASSVAAMDGITTKYTARGEPVTIVGLNTASAQMHEHLAGHLGAAH